jgi:hypothetical protein
MDEEEVHIAVGKNLRKEKVNILWAAANFPKGHHCSCPCPLVLQVVPKSKSPGVVRM